MFSTHWRPFVMGVFAASLVFACSASNETRGPSNETGASSGGAGGDGGVGFGGMGSGGSGGEAMECPNVDVLFVIDNSGSMADQQQSLIASFDGFVKGMQQQLSGAKSYHVGVVATEDYGGNNGCGLIGDLITQTSGPGSSNAVCTPFVGGGRFLTDGEANLAAKFSCVAQLGTGGSSDERPARALMNALDPARNAPGACNAGFSRKDSLLVLVVITDEDDVPDGCDGQTCMTYGSGGTPDEWSDTVIKHKGGIAQNVVVLSLIGRKLDNPCGATPASKMLGFTNNFGDNGFIGDVCATSYDQFFVDALPVIDKACQNYIPPPK
jgi:hypothetical protein